MEKTNLTSDEEIFWTAYHRIKEKPLPVCLTYTKAYTPKQFKPYHIKETV